MCTAIPWLSLENKLSVATGISYRNVIYLYLNMLLRRKFFMSFSFQRFLKLGVLWYQGNFYLQILIVFWSSLSAITRFANGRERRKALCLAKTPGMTSYVQSAKPTWLIFLCLASRRTRRRRRRQRHLNFSFWLIYLLLRNFMKWCAYDVANQLLRDDSL